MAGALGAFLLGSATLVATAPAALAEVEEAIGHETSPAQPYAGAQGESDWLGSYTVNGKQVFCVQFQFKAPDTEEPYEPGDELLTKWGTALPEDIAGNISYLLLRHGDTDNPDEAAALAHLLHSWTSAPRGPADLDPALGFDKIAYDAPYHLEKLPEGARTAVETLSADAEANRGPWSATVSAPEGEQVIGTPAEWTVSVTNAKDSGVPEVPVTLTLTDATAGGEETVTVETDEEGKAVVEVTPTGAAPKVAGAMKAPAARPYVQVPVDTNTQRVVSTGGEQDLAAEAATTARTKPGAVRVAKVDTRSGKGIAGVALRVTAADRTAPATGQDDQALVGADGKPVVVTTEGEDGAVSVPDLKAPQEICVVEVSPPSGYDDGFDPANPPSACGEVVPGETLELRIANAPNEVPHTIPAGAEPVTLAGGATTTGPSGGALAAMIGLAALASLLVGLIARRRFAGR
ncbi:hypothetical protein CFN78_08720 [Amycolatopsis antarctica]|uniref:Prealbumin-like fold domain-containing protein n=1 Tax=Amycolatopsis antarctica TaxID=1854586 RepID=A0A263D5Q0_9PSEU|nr:hypothetical protein CFN78_08720 [Amycolatopsis antarctica]